MQEECWKWPGHHRKDGRATVSGKYVYRMVWQAAFGRDPSGSLHHQCENAWCINPYHLEELHQSDHAKEHGIGGDWGQSDKTHCPQGHEYTGRNVYRYRRKNGSEERGCRTCRRNAQRRYSGKI